MTKNTSKRLILIICTVVILLSAATGTTLAYIFDRTPSIENSFEPVYVSSEVESQDGALYRVKNTGDINAYVRATFVVMWTADDGTILGTAPILGTDYTVTLGSDKWQQGSDGFYYYKDELVPDASTDVLFESVSVIGESPDGYALTLHLIATAIQSAPARVVTEVWGVTVLPDGTLSAP